MQNKSLKNPTVGKSWSLQDTKCFRFVTILQYIAFCFPKDYVRETCCKKTEKMPAIRQLGDLEIFSVTLVFPCQFFMFSPERLFCFCLHSACRQNEQTFFPCICQASLIQYWLLHLEALDGHFRIFGLTRNQFSCHLKENIFLELKVFGTISQVKLNMTFTCGLEKEI